MWRNFGNKSRVFWLTIANFFLKITIFREFTFKSSDHTGQGSAFRILTNPANRNLQASQTYLSLLYLDVDVFEVELERHLVPVVTEVRVGQRHVAVAPLSDDAWREILFPDEVTQRQELADATDRHRRLHDAIDDPGEGVERALAEYSRALSFTVYGRKYCQCDQIG